MTKVKLDIKDQFALEALKRIIASEDGFAPVPEDNTVNGGNGKFDLAIVELGERAADGEFDALRKLKENGGTKEIFLVSAKKEPDTIIRAMRTGISEFLPIPVDEAEAKDALRRFKARAGQAAQGQAQKKGKIITVLGSKGGVGSTTVAVNISAAIAAARGDRSLVCIVDLGFPFGDVASFMDINAGTGLDEITGNIERLDSTYLMSALARHSSGVYVLPSSPGGGRPRTGSGHAVGRLLQLMRGLFDFIVIDAGKALDDGLLEALRFSEQIFMVAGQSIPSMVNLRKFMQVLMDLGYPMEKNLKIIVNMYRKKDPITSQEAEKSIGAKIFGTIPDDPEAASAALNQGKPLVSAAPKSHAAASLRDLAVSITENGNVGNVGNGSQPRKNGWTAAGGIFRFFAGKE